ncbi:MAG: dihydroneopterin aldolase, partial [Firmicutes bacterium]|nr:dihydroneopterin aldolase [Bacillota bacterium]
MDKIIIKGLEIIAAHGVLPEEKILPQKFIIDIEAYADLRQAGVLDDISRTESYADIIATTTGVFTERSFGLIEKCAEESARQILLKHSKI